jgi:hypothetical protein
VVATSLKSLKDSPTLVGIDFAFSLPKPFPVAGLKNPRQIWDLIDDLCWAATDDDVREYYAGPVWLSEVSPFPPYVRYADYRGPQFDGKLLRHTERAIACLTTQLSVFSVPSHLQAVVAKDGWILGVPFGGAA